MKFPSKGKFDCQYFLQESRSSTVRSGWEKNKAEETQITRERRKEKNKARNTDYT